MKLDLHISDFTWDGGAPKLASKLGEIARLAEDVGFDRLSVMDHLWQIGHLGPPEHEMLEAYTTLGYLAAATKRAKLMTIVTASTYRTPGLLAKIVSTLDVLSGGRAWLGIGAAWNEDEARGLDLFFPPLAERYERLEEILQICPDAQLSSADHAAPSAHPDRWGRREKDVEARRTLCAGMQHFWHDGCGPQAGGAPRPL
jgi:alkanesulfonate monooxygenase SsuD/methylene tetrahydromethanopterin reductase-like flavin-dependent oxidoreductase (luciferase family)